MESEREGRLSDSSVARVEGALRTLILDGVFTPGSRLSDAKLAQDLGVGRTAVRAALVGLAKGGVVELIPNRGAFVTRFDPGQIADLYDLRELLEPQAAAFAAHRASEAATAEIGHLLAVTRITLDERPSPYPGHLDFHDAVIRASGSPALTFAAQDVNAKLTVARARAVASEQRAAEALRDHNAIFAAILQKDAVAAKELMSRHLDRGRRYIGLQPAPDVSEVPRA